MITINPQKSLEEVEPGFRPCAVIPVYNNQFTISEVVATLAEFVKDIIVVDDGSREETRRVIHRLEQDGAVSAVFRSSNGGKGAAVKDGFLEAQRLGFSHALQVDADGQHDLSQASFFLQEAENCPQALVLGFPVFGAEAPVSRIRGRILTNAFVSWEVGRGVIKDAMIGFRVYPLDAVLALNETTNRMDFDIEIAVRLAWSGVPTLNHPVAVRYLQAAEGGISSFRPFADNARITLLHVRLSIIALYRRLFRFSPFGSKHAKTKSWMHQSELGLTLGIRLLLILYRILGRWLLRFILAIVALYYVCRYQRIRRASRDYLSKIFSSRIRFGQVCHHVYTFALVTFDRMLWASGRHKCFEIEVNGCEGLDLLTRSGSGAIFLTAHLGSAGAISPEFMPDGFKMNIAGYYSNAKKINKVFSDLAGESAPTIINLEQGEVDSMIRLHELLMNGEGVTLAADRTGVNGRVLSVEFLGSNVEIPAGPFLLAALSSRPVYFITALFQHPNKYQLICQKLHAGITVNRSQRDDAIASLAASYVEQLEKWCHAAPYNWFNFYQFWKK